MLDDMDGLLSQRSSGPPQPSKAMVFSPYVELHRGGQRWKSQRCSYPLPMYVIGRSHEEGPVSSHSQVSGNFKKATTAVLSHRPLDTQRFGYSASMVVDLDL